MVFVISSIRLRAAYQLALQALDRVEATSRPTSDVSRRCELLLALGRAHATAGEREPSKQSYRQAADVARRLGATEQLARASLGFAGLSIEAGAVDRDVMAMLEEALHTLGSAETALAARVMARLSQELGLPEHGERRRALSEHALDVARRSGDPRALGEALVARHVALRGPGNAEERLAISSQLLHLGRKAGNKELAGWGHGFRIVDRMEQGDLVAANRDSEACGDLGEEIRHPLFLWVRAVSRGMLALLQGRLEASEQLAEEAHRLVLPVDPDASALFGDQLLALRSEQGRLDEVVPVLEEFVGQYPEMPAWRATLAAVYSRLGRGAEARSEFEQLAARDFADLPRDGAWLPGVAALAETCALLADERRAAVLYDLMIPHAPYHVVLENALWNGAVSYYLGLLATTMGRWECASEHFAAALDVHRQVGAACWLGCTQYEYARMLLARGRGDDTGRARGGEQAHSRRHQAHPGRQSDARAPPRGDHQHRLHLQLPARAGRACRLAAVSPDAFAPEHACLEAPAPQAGGADASESVDTPLAGFARGPCPQLPGGRTAMPAALR